MRSRLLSPGETFDRYTIEALIGEGGMGRVYRARDPRLQRLVALKVLRVDPAAPPQEQARANAKLLREARAAAALSHANAVAIHDVGECDGVSFIAMELVEGLSLRAYVGDKSVPMQVRVRILADIARALGAAHEGGLVHRDVKPENVMVRRDGGVKVLDFGIARAFSEVDGSASRPRTHPGEKPLFAHTMTGDGSVTGTPRYMAPEQLVGDPLDARVDQFAWGVVAYELLTGRAPWDGDSESLSFLASIQSFDAAPLRAIDSAVAERVEAIVLRALAKDRDDRFASMADLLLALDGHPDTVPLPVGAGDARVGLTSLEGTEGPLERSSELPPRPSSAPRRRRRFLLAAATVAVVALASTAGLGLRARRTQEVPLRLAAELPVSATTKMTDYPAPASNVPDAQAAYVSGVRLVHDGSTVPGLKALRQAVELDPTMAAAYLRLIVYGRDVWEGDPQASFGKAEELRAALSPRDREILSALEPSFLDEADDSATETESTRRTLALAASHPFDAELQYLAARANIPQDSAQTYAVRAIADDPTFATAMWFIASLRVLQGDLDGAVSGFGQCVAVAPQATACRSARALLFERTGQCDAMEADARAVQLLAPSERSHDLVARALLAKGAPVAAVRDVLEQKWAATDATVRKLRVYEDERHLAEYGGDFAAAERLLVEEEAETASSTRENDHEAGALSLLEILEEEGRTVDAARAASAYLDKRQAWRTQGPLAPVPRMLAVAVHGGLRTEAERDAGRQAWLDSWKDVVGYRHDQWWIYGYAYPASTEAEGKEALAVAPAKLPTPLMNQFNMIYLGAVGTTLYLGGRYEDALPVLRQDASSCALLSAPMQQTRSHLFYGETLEKTGDTAGACREYATVIQRWGAAKPRSVTADLARARSTALRCPSP